MRAIPIILKVETCSFQIIYPAKKAKQFVRAVVINQIVVNFGEFE